MSKHTHYCPKCDTDTACDHDCPNEPHVGALYNLGNAVECAKCAAGDPRLAQLETERIALNVLVQKAASQARREIIASLVPHVAAGICAAAVAKDWTEEDTGRAIFVQAERIYQEGVRRGIYQGRVE